MKRGFLWICFTLVVFEAYSQTWTIQLTDGSVEKEFTIITKAQFDRIVRSHETTDQSVLIAYTDNAEQKGWKSSKGNYSPQGYFYVSIRIIPKTNDDKLVASYITTMVGYGNSNTGLMELIFLNTSMIPGTISLQYNWNEYVRKYNSLIKLVNDE
jgi:hypothetical protein